MKDLKPESTGTAMVDYVTISVESLTAFLRERDHIYKQRDELQTRMTEMAMERQSGYKKAYEAAATVCDSVIEEANKAMQIGNADTCARRIRELKP